MQDLVLADYAVVIADDPELDLDTHARPKGCYCQSANLSADTIADHPHLPHFALLPVASAINNSNWIAGASILCTPGRCTDQSAERATLWRPSGTGYTAVDLGLPSRRGEDSAATGINDRGQLVGSSNAIAGAVITGFLWDGGDITLLPPGPGTDAAVPRTVNESGQAVGFSRDLSGPVGDDDATL